MVSRTDTCSRQFPERTIFASDFSDWWIRAVDGRLVDAIARWSGMDGQIAGVSA